MQKMVMSKLNGGLTRLGCRWRRPEGRAFEMTMCELKRRVLGATKIALDTEACTLDCGELGKRGKVLQQLETHAGCVRMGPHQDCYNTKGVTTGLHDFRSRSL